MANPVADVAKGGNERESVGVVGRTPKERDESLMTLKETGKSRIIWTWQTFCDHLCSTKILCILLSSISKFRGLHIFLMTVN